ncbi:winged helix DNA-binding domain-containing protein [Isoptericola variabilis]|uniref:Winged helix DNA-binding domain-containing protein n=1 Tax=Isoptericola variabilis (strain 225) TaxID=743718 RepID=F6FR76_ISOV2|nr:winged helix DNA-binding domain-containing protein [Isoptericola variabilis]AEG42936.1 hypothetical protein Isova_0123 [Isoptericola variabilis 225]TWH31814.1 winged helix DNA-binding protein [Isoptericola variabilis J7]
MPEPAIGPDELLRARLRAHRVTEPDLPDLPSVVGHFLAVQGQELRPALWGASRRVEPGREPGASGAAAALDAGEVLRTHVLRPTWHLVRPDDARWLIELTAPRVRRQMASTERAWGIGDPGPGMDCVAAEVAAGPRTRAELRDALVARGLVAEDAPGIHVTQVLMHAELERLVVSGPARDRQQTYAAFDDRAPAGYGPLGERFDAEAAVVELWRRYLPSRAYATVKDVAQWATLTLADLRRGLQVLLDAGEAVEVPGAGRLEGLTFYRAASVPDAGAPTGAPPSGTLRVDLLQAYDELFCSYRESRDVVLEPGAEPPDRRGAYVHCIAVDGRVAGRWRWPSAGVAAGGLDVQWSREPTAAERSALDLAAADLASYLAT